MTDDLGKHLAQNNLGPSTLRCRITLQHLLWEVLDVIWELKDKQKLCRNIST